MGCHNLDFDPAQDVTDKDVNSWERDEDESEPYAVSVKFIEADEADEV
ncbi:hypothetical protein [Nocardia transvalensis]|nr:hypothetical protein [Nocardia transvalensis]MBF6327603.1 hypothetical protein [Nocardia transvalensis]